MFVINAEGGIIYTGAIDASSALDADPGKTQNFVKHALVALFDGREVSEPATTPYGCSVKYAN